MRKINFVFFMLFVIISPFFISHIDIIEEYQSTSQEIVEIWQIDTFEAGSLSRTSMLTSLSSDFYNENVLIYIRNIDYDIAISNMKNGQYPDLISFGSGVDTEIVNFISELSNEYGLPSSVSSSGVISNKLYAIPYMISAYCVISHNELNQDLTAEENILTAEEIYFGGDSMMSPYEYISTLKDFENNDLTPYQAYTSFSQNPNSILIGSLRDVQRTINNSKISSNTFYYQTLSYFGLADYLSICSFSDSQYSEKVLNHIFSNLNSDFVSSSGLLSPYKINSYGTEPMNSIENFIYENLDLEYIW